MHKTLGLVVVGMLVACGPEVALPAPGNFVVGARAPDGGVAPVAPARAADDGGADAGDAVGPVVVDAGCAPRACDEAGAQCGSGEDGCGGLLFCGDCAEPDVCGAAGPNRCGTPPFCDSDAHCAQGSRCDQAKHRCVCVPKTCDDLGAECGVDLPDGCGGVIAACGVGAACGPFMRCGAALQCECSSTVDLPDDAFEDTNCDGLDGDEREAIFVAPRGNDLNPGTRTHPVATLAKAAQLATAAGKREVYVAQGTFAAPAGWPSGLGLYGGYDTSWRRGPADAQRAVIQAPSVGWLIDGLAARTTLERLAIEGASSAPGAPAMALRVVDSDAHLALRFVSVTAGFASAGVSGAAGTAGSPGAPGRAGDDAVPGAPELAPGGGHAGDSGRPEAGGAGGLGGSVFVPAQRGQATSGAAGGVAGLEGCAGVTDGGSGDDGRSGARGAEGSAAAGSGALDDAGVWSPSSRFGTSGHAGAAGLGGGGGGGGGRLACAGGSEAGGGGGGGGAGGRGGAGGSGGQSGGAAIALALVRSAPTLHEVSLGTGAGGRGGVGGVGGSGGQGGVGGAGGRSAGLFDAKGRWFESGSGGAGGRGGAGGQGGRGGDGAPGPSIGVWCADVTTTLDVSRVSWRLGPAGSGAGLRAEVLGCP